jgi:branched-chain amino acid transport system permease protein
MSQATGSGDAVVAMKRRPRVGLGAYWPWILLLLIALVLPWPFYDYAHGRENGFLISVFSQMAMMIIFALSYNMLMGQAGLLSFCHAAFFGFGGYCVAHFLNAANDGGFAVPLELLPLAAGLCSLGLAVVFGAIATKQRSTAFAMITFGIGQLMATAALMFQHFFGGEGGITTDRQNVPSLFGINYAHGIEVYYLIVVWMFLAVVAMHYLTLTPLGRMANACRDNYERAQFVGYDPRMVRFIQFVLAGFFAGVGGGLYAITYEIVTFDAVNAPLSGNVLLMAYIGGATTFVGPIVGAILITLLQSGLSRLSNSWVVYVGVLFIAMVIFAPTGLAGMVLAHRPVARAGRLGKLVVPYLRIAPAFLAMAAGFVGIVELASFLSIGRSQGKKLMFFGSPIDVSAMQPWLIAAALLIGGGLWLWRETIAFRRTWDLLNDDLKHGG